MHLRMMAAVLVLAGLLCGPAQALTVRTERVEAEILPEWTSLPPEGGTFRIAIRQKIIPGWHTYWSNPGDSGEPTKVLWTYQGRKESWSLPPGFEAGELQFPAPSRIPYGPLVNFGYMGRAVYLTTMTAPAGLRPGTDVTLKAQLRWLVCEEICIPEMVDAVLVLPVREGPPLIDGRARRVIESAEMPERSPWPARFGLSGGRLTLGVAAPEMREAFASGKLTQAVFFPYRDGLIANAAPQSVSFGAGGFSIAVEPGFHFTEEGDEAPQDMSGVVVLTDMSGGKPRRRAFTFEAPRAEVPADWRTQPLLAVTPALTSKLGWGQVALFAVLGGLILNLMPCVFPILFLKAFGFARTAHKPHAHVRLHGLVFTAGVVLSFAAVGLVLLALRAGGERIGWGFQLQSPVFVSVLLYLLTLVGLSLSGVFALGQSLMSLGAGAAVRNGTTGAFFTGVLATVVATPCTAPFMGAAVGFSLTQPPALAVGVFVLLGLGMAMPWLALSFSPQLLKVLPKPGPWMEKAKHLLAFPIYATALWLLWVLTFQVGSLTLSFVFGGLLLVGFAAWAWGEHQKGGHGAWHLGTRIAALVALAGAVALLFAMEPRQPEGGGRAAAAAEDPGAIVYEPFSAARLAALRAEGRPVFVNATAAWCITCLFNERATLSSPELTERMTEAGVVALKADWTNYDAEITDFLERFGRSGVPLYVFYPAGAGAEPVVLPQILKKSALLGHLGGTHPSADQSTLKENPS